ncbi:MAG: bifunctional 4-hydroxy-2-oxoglutarate aldolase/2-dehydro-3-deoxy-phosphogluconate aldolase [Chitinivibrionales bacterium]|nr:bifunctional 4-hydroxy-2-oxoglutarate aldolase/2-dehydro-3-deoxy-phosphogluconate aldolase [Chitinivibrionales bacterium]
MLMHQLYQKRIIPVAAVNSAEEALGLCDALAAGGLTILEITLRTEGAIRAIAEAAKRYPSMLIGAGTIMSPAQVTRACEAGAQFGVSPGIDADIVAQAQAHALPFIPGVMTPAEVQRGLGMGCTLLKFFPAEAAGGTAMLKALDGPFKSTGVKFIPLGGVGPANARDYLNMSNVAAIGGSWLARPSLIEGRKWKEITAKAQQALQMVAEAQQANPLSA